MLASSPPSWHGEKGDVGESTWTSPIREGDSEGGEYDLGGRAQASCEEPGKPFERRTIDVAPSEQGFLGRQVENQRADARRHHYDSSVLAVLLYTLTTVYISCT